MEVNSQIYLSHFLFFWGLNFIFLFFRDAFVNELHIQGQKWLFTLAISYYTKLVFYKIDVVGFILTSALLKSMLMLLLLTSVVSTSVNNRCWKFLITDVETLFFSSRGIGFYINCRKSWTTLFWAEMILLFIHCFFKKRNYKIHLWKELLKNCPVEVSFFCGRSVFRVNKIGSHHRRICDLVIYWKKKTKVQLIKTYGITSKKEVQRHKLKPTCLFAWSFKPSIQL